VASGVPFLAALLTGAVADTPFSAAELGEAVQRINASTDRKKESSF